MTDNKHHGGHAEESKNRQSSDKTAEKSHEQQRRGPGSEQEYQGDQSNERRANVDQEREEKERKRA